MTSMRKRRLSARALAGYFVAASLLVVSPAFAEADPQFLNDRAARLIKAGELDAALKDLNESLRLSPGQASALLNRGVAYVRKGEFALAMADYNASIAIEPIYPAYTSRGSLYARMGQFDRAVEDYRAALKIEPLSSFTLMNLALAYMNLGRYGEALQAVDHSYRLKTEPRAQVIRGEILLKTEDYAGAVKAYTKAITTMRSYAVAYQDRAYAYIKLGEYDLAMADVAKAISLEPENPAYPNERCWLRGMTGRELPLALADCGRALELSPDEPGILHSRALVYTQLGDFAAAAADLERVLRSTPDEPDALFLRGAIRLKQGREAEARVDIDKAKAVRPSVTRDYQGLGLPAWAMGAGG